MQKTGKQKKRGAAPRESRPSPDTFLVVSSTNQLFVLAIHLLHGLRPSLSTKLRGNILHVMGRLGMFCGFSQDVVFGIGFYFEATSRINISTLQNFCHTESPSKELAGQTFIVDRETVAVNQTCEGKTHGVW